MGLISAKVAGIVLASSVAVSGVGYVAYNGHDTISQAKKDLNDAANKIVGLSFSQGRLQDYIADFKKSVNATVAQANTVIGNKNVSIGQLQDDNAKKSKEIEELLTKIKGLEKELTTIKSEYAELESEHEKVKQELFTAMKDLEETKQLLFDTTEELKAALAANAQLQEENKNLAETNVKLVGQVNQANTDAVELKKAMEDANAKIDKAYEGNLDEAAIKAIGWEVPPVVDSGIETSNQK
ncbi:hypothetical protein [Bacillus testis]|uniref:hypothetical protein n=1 Tax=Bacillus testis TaxID=1622072 RepID=UPI00067F1A0B|nr:hypothetical protein [Bacillus testis]